MKLKGYLVLMFCLFKCYEQKPLNEDNARVLVEKKVYSKYVAEKEEFIVKYTLYNIGNLPAYNVSLFDESWDGKYFTITAGEKRSYFQSIPPRSQISFVMVIRPEIAGTVEVSSANIQYRVGSVDGNIGYSNELNNIEILQFNVFQQRVGQFNDWISFLLVGMPTFLIPVLLWQSKKYSYQQIAKPYRRKSVIR